MMKQYSRIQGQGTTIRSGPSASANWEQKEIIVKCTKKLLIRRLPDAAAPLDKPLYHVLLGLPVIHRDSSGKPLFSLVIVLKRQPTADEDDLKHLIQSGTVSMELKLSVPDEVLGKLGSNGHAEYRPLFARETCFKLEAARDSNNEVLASTDMSGADLRGSLTVILSRTDCLQVLKSLEGVSSELQVRSEVSFRTGCLESQVRLDGSWAVVYDYLKSRSNADGQLSLKQLRKYLRELLDTGAIMVYEVSSSGEEKVIVPGDSDDIFKKIITISAVILTRITIEIPADHPQNVYRLKERPHPSLMLTYTFKTTGSTMRREVVITGLHEVLGGILDGLDRGEFIRLACMSKGDNNGAFVVSRRLPSVRPRGPADPEHLKLCALSRALESVSRAMQPSVGLKTATAFVHSNLVGPKYFVGSSAGKVSNQWWVDNAVLKEGERHNLPIVEDPSAPIWRDRLDSKLYWYAPALEVIQPSPAASAESSPFLFTYRRVGVTAAGEPALVGSVLLTLRKKISENTRFALHSLAGVKSKPILMHSINVLLSIPFVDERDGTLRRTDLQAKVTEEKDEIAVKVDLLNESVRLCYGVLAFPNFQSEPARLELTYCFDAYSPVKKTKVKLVAGAKVALTPIARTAAESLMLGVKPHYDASSGKFRLPVGEFQLIREASQEMKSETMRAKPSMMAVSTTVSKPLTMVANTAIWKPQLMVSGTFAKAVEKTKYAQRSIVRQEQLDTLFPCEGLGEYYRHETDIGTEAVGCVDALKLGQTTVRQYSEISELSHLRYRVLRSLQQPGRFLILPRWYKITRFSPLIAAKAYRPAIACYSAIDIETPANNRVIYHATLQPDIPVAVRRELQKRLTKEAREPSLEYPTEISAEINYTWTVGAGIIVEPNVVRTPDSFQVTLATDFAGALLLRNMIQTSGVMASAKFQLPDGSNFQTNLSVQLTDIEGPWDTGPLEVELESEQITLTNRIEQAIAVSDLLIYRDEIAEEKLPVEAHVEPSSSLTLQISTGVTEAYAFYEIATGEASTIEEIRSFIEDIHTNVVFVDLINYQNHNLAKLEMQARLKNVPGVRDVEMQGTPPQGEAQFVLPLTTYLSQRILQFRVKKILNSGQELWTSWIEWDLENAGNIVSLTWELIG
jgi:hypothetical protein